jgi:glyoxylase-like metal-dependent hydrolase (beta-lactamase superfamily II)
MVRVADDANGRLPPMQQWKIGAVTVTSVVEYEVPLPPGGFLPGATPELVAEQDWLRPDFADENGQLILRIQALVVESEGTRIVVDTCVGNDKPRTRELFDRIQGPFLTNFLDAGFRCETVDRVICTHLHIDHIGWNTRIGPDGSWVPTFPNARYLFARVEYEHWSVEPSPDGDLFADSVQPVVDAGLVDLVDTDHAVTSEVALLPTPGHTPGHVSVAIDSAGERAVITGDVLHHPLQCAAPHLATVFDSDRAAAEAQRRACLARWCDEQVLVIGTHFPGAAAGHLVPHGDGYRVAPVRV